MFAGSLLEFAGKARNADHVPDRGLFFRTVDLEVVREKVPFTARFDKNERIGGKEPCCVIKVRVSFACRDDQ